MESALIRLANTRHGVDRRICVPDSKAQSFYRALIISAKKEEKITLLIMKKDQKNPETKWRKSIGSLCAVLGLLLSIVCCIALVHVEFRIQEHHRLLSHPTTFCDQIEKEILRKVQENFKRWAAGTDKGKSGK